MELRLLPILTFFSVVVVVSHAAVSPEDYWKQVLPNTPMPGAVRNSLQSTEWDQDKSTSVGVGKGGVNVNTDKPQGKGTDVSVGHGNVGVHTGTPQGGGTNVNVGHGNVGVHTPKHQGGGTNINVGHGNIDVNTNKPKGKGGADVNVGRKGGVGVKTGKPGHGTKVGVGKGGVSVHTGPKKKPVVVGVKPGNNPFNYKYAATETQLHENPNVALFFQEQDLKPGKSMNLHFTKNNEESTFLTRKDAESIPFSTQKMPEILSQYNLKPESEEAQIMKQTLKDCEDKGNEGEDKYCATSLEGMVDYTISKLGKNIKATSTEVTGMKENEPQKYTIKGVRKNGKDDHGVVCHKQKYSYAVFYCHEAKNTASYEVEMVGEDGMKENKPQKYTIKGVRKNGKDDHGVVCHKQKYSYAVFYCHEAKNTASYEVEMVGEDGMKVKGEAVCHKDTSKWNPKHLAFQVLNVEPGTVPVCHFLPQDHVVWVKNY